MVVALVVVNSVFPEVVVIVGNAGLLITTSLVILPLIVVSRTVYVYSKFPP